MIDCVRITQHELICAIAETNQSIQETYEKLKGQQELLKKLSMQLNETFTRVPELDEWES